jgi:hypothetical protein
VQANQARGLRGQAVGCHQLLLLADRAGEAERVRAEADQSDNRDQRQAQRGGCQYAQSLAPLAWRQQQKRQREAGGDLDPDSRDQRGCAGTKARVGAGSEQQRGGEREQQQHVVVGAADRQLEQHRVQAHEGGGEARSTPAVECSAQAPRRLSRRVGDPPGGRVTSRALCGQRFTLGRLAQQCDRGKAGGDRQCLHCPQPAGEPERGDRVAREREQWAVG